MESYWSEDSYEGGYYSKNYKYQKKPYQKTQTFVPSYGSEISLYKTKMCRFIVQYGNCTQNNNCIHAHSKHELRRDPRQPIPVWVKGIYEKMQRNKNRNYAKFDTKTTAHHEKRNFIFEEGDEEAHKPKFVGSNIPLNRAPARSGTQYDTHSVGIPVITGTPIQQTDNIEEAYKKLKIENLDLQATIAKVQRDNEVLEQKLQESSKKCVNYESVIEKYKGVAESIGSELEQAKKGQMSKENQTIQELRKMVKELQQENSQLTDKNKELLNRVHNEDRSGDAYYEIAMHAIKQLEEMTRSYLTKKLMNHPVLTPSLTIVDKKDVFNILDHEPSHPYNRIQKVQKAKIFPPIMKAVQLRAELKRMIEEQESYDEGTKESGFNTYSKNSEELLEKISQLESRLTDRNQEIKGCNFHKRELDNQLHSCKMTISKLRNELEFTKKNYYQLKEDASNAYTEEDVADYKRQITQLHETIRKYKKENTDYNDQVTALQRNLVKLRAADAEIANKNQEISGLKKAQEEQSKLITESEQKVTSLEAELQKLTQEKQGIEQDLGVKINSLKQDVARRNKIILNQKKQIDSLADSEALKHQNEALQQRHVQLCDSIEAMLECKETNEPMKIPCFTPSGNTVEKEVMQKWILNGQKDPWNGKPCKDIIKNLLATELNILLDQYKVMTQS
ncbi:unnamed protein product [Moneuplotes crassus]|uniref:C3H1-type domain-containing protein n=1 Tax=Euplotes crassus TaxID=5936 RepID=A0AAD1Y8L6_EUPCR|nr:unnamed protein product [Moneuplotes crassus]